MRKFKQTAVVALVVISVLILVAGQSLAKEKVDWVPIGLNLELTGGLAAATIPISYGFVDYFTNINDQGGFEYTSPEDGKVHRAKYKILWADNGFSVPRSITNVRRFIDQGARMILTA